MKPIIRSSELDRVLACNGSLTLVPLVAPRDGNEGNEGTDIHRKIAFRLVSEAGATGPESLKGYAYPVKAHITDWIAQFCYKAVKEHVPTDWSLECEMPLSYEWDRFILSGHPDVVALSPDVTEFYVDDFKTGYIPVDIAESNWQLLAYAVLIKRAYPTLQRGTLRIIQPRNNEDDGFPRISEATIENIDVATVGLEKRINAALDNPMEVNSGPSQCKWCPLAGPQCPATLGVQKLMKATLTQEAIARIKLEPDDAQLGDWIVTARTLERATEDAKNLLHERLDKVPSITSGSGVQITRKVQKGSWSWSDPFATFNAIKTILPEDTSLAKVLRPSVSAIKDEIAEIMDIPKTGKAPITADGVFQAHIAPTGTQGERKLLVFS
jgi:hypothetical protein